MANKLTQDAAALDPLIYGDLAAAYPTGVLDALKSLQSDLQKMSALDVFDSRATLDDAVKSANEVNSQMSCPALSPTPSTSPTGPPGRTIQDGTWQVGKAVKPGVYRLLAPFHGCYYARLRNFNGANDIIANGLPTGESWVVEIRSTDAGFESDHCGTWTSDLSRVSQSLTTITDGEWIVGTDLQPGTYRTTSAKGGCYYARLSNFSGVSDIVSNDLGGGPHIITIGSGDAGFQTEKCGVWKKI
ncbi:MAG: hypothetical protein M3Q23_16180 [Actinomycetota bacterium]|nr:hypothetical protein [Actinomycetota bacterium]